jgi:hypothetical protein
MFKYKKIEIINKIKEIQLKIQQAKLEDNLIDYNKYIKELIFWRNKQLLLKKRKNIKRKGDKNE